MSNDFVSIYRG